MRYLLFTLLALLICSLVKAQTGTQIENSPLYYSGLKVGLNVNTPQHGMLEINGSGASNGLTLWTNSGETTSRLWIDASSNLFHITRGAQGTNGIAIKANGDVGIGTIAPLYKLDVDGYARFQSGFFGGTGTTSIQLVDKSWSGSHAILFNAYKNGNQVNGSLATTGNTRYSNEPGDHGSGAGSIMFFGNGGTMGFYISPTSTGKDNAVDWGGAKMVIKRTGNVGIGNTTPDYKLSVDGTIQAEEVRVESVPQSDYVFEPDYNLLPITEVETFIKENKHLPEIPSAKEFKENGVGLGEMDDMLLRKVEELTLYVIELKKENEELKTEKDAEIKALIERIEQLENK